MIKSSVEDADKIYFMKTNDHLIDRRHGWLFLTVCHLLLLLCYFLFLCGESGLVEGIMHGKNPFPQGNVPPTTRHGNLIFTADQ